MTDAAERAADAEQAEAEALNWQAEQHRTQEAMRAVLEAVMADIDAAIATTEAGREPADTAGFSNYYINGSLIAGLVFARGYVVKHAAAAGVELESNE